MIQTVFPCQWSNCEESCTSAEDLFTHLSEKHIGRKATNNLCLQCQWNNCGTVAAKRDHLASHVRVHVPLKPHQCSICSKAFKRPQDLKKHERIHTAEHQASLLSNQPGYKPVRRRRRKTANTIASTNSSSSTKYTHLSSNKDLLSLRSSPSFSLENNESHKLYPETDEEYFNSGYLQQDPVQDFIDDVLYNQASPTYDTDMMEKLNSIAPILEQQNNWNLPCEPDSIPALHNWLEQLSANINTEENIYPDILNNNVDLFQQPQLSTTNNYDLYPKLMVEEDEQVINDLTSQLLNHDSPSTYNTLTDSQNIFLSPSIQQTTSASESSVVHTPSYDEDDKNSITIQPQFWSPGYIHSPLYNNNSMLSPSMSIDVNTTKTKTKPEKATVFEASQQETHVALTPVMDVSTNSASFENKKELIHMINVFSSAKVTPTYKKQKDHVKLDDTKKTVSDKAEPEKKDKVKEDVSPIIINTASSPSNNNYHTILNEPHHSPHELEDENIKSPYANLVDLIKDLKIKGTDNKDEEEHEAEEVYEDEEEDEDEEEYEDEEEDEDGEEYEDEDEEEDELSIRRRHALVVDRLWKAVSARLTTLQ